MSGQSRLLPAPDRSAFLQNGAELAPSLRQRLRALIDGLPDRPSRLRVMGHVLLDLGLHDLAIEALGRALLLDDLDGATHLGLTRAYLQAGRRETALVHLDIAIALRPDAGELRVLAADILGCRNHLRALDQLGTVLLADPAHRGARKGLAALIRAVVAGRLAGQKPEIVLPFDRDVSASAPIPATATTETVSPPDNWPAWPVWPDGGANDEWRSVARVTNGGGNGAPDGDIKPGAADDGAVDDLRPAEMVRLFYWHRAGFEPEPHLAPPRPWFTDRI